MYFNAIFALAVGAAYALTNFEPLLLLVVLQTFAIVQQSLPFLRLDGYYIISDLTGVPDILMRIKSVLVSLVPWRKPDERVTELKPWVRVAVTSYIAVLVPALALMFTLMVINAPRFFATGWDSFWTHYDAVGPAFAKSQTLRGIREALQMVVLALPAIGFAYTAIRIAARGGAGAWRWSDGSVVRRAGVTLAGTAVVGAIAFTWWPNGEYRPIQPGERGTLTGGFKQLANVGSGRAALTPERQQQLHGAPSRRQPSKPSGAQAKPGAAAKAKKGTQGSVSDQPATKSTDQTSAEPQATPEASSPPPEESTPAPQDPSAPQETTTDPSASSTPPPDQTSTQPQDGGAQMTPAPASP
jgi:hypothetical protein